MDYCELCFDRPQPLVCQGEGRVRLDALDGRRRLLGELEFHGPVTLHFVEVDAARRMWYSEDRALYAVTVYNRSSLPMDRVVVSGGTGRFLDGSVRINGLSQSRENPGAGVELPGLDAGCEAVVTWQERLPQGTSLEETPAQVRYEYRFGGERLEGETQA